MRLQIILFCLYCTLSLPVLANHPQECFNGYNPVDHLHDVNLAYVHGKRNAQSRCIVNSPFQGVHSNPYYPQISRALSRTTQFRNQLDSHLTTAIREEVQQAIAGKASLNSASARINGPITIQLLGQPNSAGVLNMMIGGFDLASNIRFSKSWYATGSISVNASNLQFTAHYDVNTGLVTAVEPVYDQLDVRVSLSSPLEYLLPGFGTAFRIALQNRVRSQIRADIRESLRRVGGATSTMFALNQEIPIGEFIYAGQDFGLVLRDQLSHHISNAHVVIRQSGKTFDNAYLYISLQGFELTFGQQRFETMYCPTCVLH